MAPRSGPGGSIVLATNNARKLAELRRIVAEAAPEVQVLGLADLPAYPEPAETERTFAGNALLKARAAVAATGLPALADDSGLEVEVAEPDARRPLGALERAPGHAIPTTTSCCSASSATSRRPTEPPASSAPWPRCCRTGPNTSVSASCRGGWSEAPRGQNGFGYDPLFVAEGNTVTNGELDPSAKDAISHRGQAVRAIVPVLIEELRRLTPVSQEG